MVSDRTRGRRAGWGTLCVAVLLAPGCHAQSDEAARSWQIDGSWGELSFELATDDPIGEGDNELELRVLEEGAALDDVEVDASVQMTSMGHGETPVAVRDGGEGRFVIDLELSMPGEWLLVINVARGDEVLDGCQLELEVR